MKKRMRKLTSRMQSALERINKGDVLYYHGGQIAFMRLPRSYKSTFNGLFDRGLIEHEPEFEGAITGFIVLSKAGSKFLKRGIAQQ